MRQVLTLVGVAALSIGAAGCGSDDDTPGAADAEAGEERASIVVTTNILGDVVSQVIGGSADVEVIMPLGADPHDFAASARQAEAMEDADLLVVNGAGFEEGMAGVISSVTAGGTPVFGFADATDLLDAGEDRHDDQGDEGDGGHGAFDPHVWTDPARMVAGVEGLGAALSTIDGIDADVLAEDVAAYVAQLEALDAEVESLLDAVPAVDRVLVTNHEAFAYFADRYGFELVGAIVPSLTTAANTSARALEELAEVIEAEGISAIFAETTQSTDLAAAIADEVGGEIEIVELFTESLGEPGSGAETYIELMRTNARMIAAALTGS